MENFVIRYELLDDHPDITGGTYESKVLPRKGESVHIAYNDEDFDEDFNERYYFGEVYNVVHTNSKMDYDVLLYLKNT